MNFSPGPSKIVKSSKVVRTLPTLPQGVGMACTRPGYIRYLDELRARLSNVRHEGKRINVKFLEYSDSLNRGVVSNTSAQILNQRPTSILRIMDQIFPDSTRQWEVFIIF